MRGFLVSIRPLRPTLSVICEKPVYNLVINVECIASIFEKQGLVDCLTRI